MGRNIDQAKQRFKQCYLDSAASGRMVYKSGLMISTDDTERCNRPRQAVVPENIKRKKSAQVLLESLRLLRETTTTPMILKGSVLTVLRERLSMGKLCSQRVQSSSEKKNVELFMRIKQRFFLLICDKRCCMDSSLHGFIAAFITTVSQLNNK